MVSSVPSGLGFSPHALIQACHAITVGACSNMAKTTNCSLEFQAKPEFEHLKEIRGFAAAKKLGRQASQHSSIQLKFLFSLSLLVAYGRLLSARFFLPDKGSVSDSVLPFYCRINLSLHVIRYRSHIVFTFGMFRNLGH